jgi:hypothetical protein
VRTKRGKTYRRSIEKLAVQIGNQGVRHALKEEHAEKLRSQGVNSQNRILAAVKGIFSRKVNQQAGVLHAMNPGPHGGSSHSWFAELTGAFKHGYTPMDSTDTEHSGSRHSAQIRQSKGRSAVTMAEWDYRPRAYGHSTTNWTSVHQQTFRERYGTENVSHIPHNPNRWVR